MVGKIAIIAVLASLAVAAQGHGLHNSINNVNVAPMYLQERTVELPSFSEIILKGAKIAFSILKPAWSVVGFKLGAIALIANLVIWGLKHSFLIVLGAAGMFGFCKLTGKCSISHIPQPFLDIGDTLVYAARELQNGIDLYGNSDLY